MWEKIILWVVIITIVVLFNLCLYVPLLIKKNRLKRKLLQKSLTKELESLITDLGGDTKDIIEPLLKEQLLNKEKQIYKTASFILFLWCNIIEASKNDTFFKFEARYSYRDCLEAMKKNGLISGYSTQDRKIFM